VICAGSNADSVVVVHGLLGEHNPPWRNRGSGDSSWMSRRQWEGKRVLSFGYDMRRILVGRQTRQAVRRQALKLLKGLKKDQESMTKVRKLQEQIFDWKITG
jgi:hypothetical protein